MSGIGPSQTVQESGSGSGGLTHAAARKSNERHVELREVLLRIGGQAKDSRQGRYQLALLFDQHAETGQSILITDPPEGSRLTLPDPGEQRINSLRVAGCRH